MNVSQVDNEVLARVHGEPFTRLPQSLYIPPDALEVFLETFEGPLDLLLYLIKRQNLDILDIPISEITRQYMGYIAAMQERLDLAAEYLVMAAMLAEIKSRLLLPRSQEGEDDEEDPRAELVRRLQEYERFKQAAETLDALPRLDRDLHPLRVAALDRGPRQSPPVVGLDELLTALREVLARSQLHEHHQIHGEALSVRERMSQILERLEPEEFDHFETLFSPQEGRLGVVVTLLAILELVREALLELVQAEPFAPIYVRLRA